MKRKSTMLSAILNLEFTGFETSDWNMALKSTLDKVEQMDPSPSSDEFIAILECLPNIELKINGLVVGSIKVPWRAIVEEKVMELCSAA